MKTILITGGAGLIGSNLCAKLLAEKDNKVIVLDNLLTSDGSNIHRHSLSPNFIFISHDITQNVNEKLKKKLGKIDEIYHLACPTGVPNLVKLAEEMLLTCSVGTKNILDLALGNNATLVFTSSSEVYGDPEVFPQREDYTGNVDTTGIRSPYEEGKRFSESIIMMYVRKYGLNAKIVRVFNTYGPGASRKESRVVSVFLKKAVSGLDLPVAGNGSQQRTFCYVDDLVNALLIVMQKGKQGEIYNAGGDEEISILDLAGMIIKITKSNSKIEFVDRPKHDHKSRRPDLEKIKMLGWSQEIGLLEGIRKTAGDYFNASFSPSP